MALQPLGWQVLPGALTAIVCAACGPAVGSTYDRAFAAAQREESAGRLAQAADGYDRAAPLATRHGDADQARWAAADVLARQQRIPEALAHLDALALEAGSGLQAEAAYRAATLRIDHGDPDRGWHDMEQVPRRFPKTGSAHAATRRLVAHADEQGPRAGLDELAALEHDVGSTELGELVAALSAEHLETLGDTRAARDAYVRIAERWPYPFGAFFDTALWKASLLDETLGQPQLAADHLVQMVSVRETTTLMGSYERKHYVPAMLRLAKLYAGPLGDRAKARTTLHTLYTDYAHSTMRDDALWLEAALWKQDGDASTACARLATLVHDFPDSRFVPCATAECQGLSRPDSSGAPKTCRPYLERSGWEPKTE